MPARHTEHDSGDFRLFVANSGMPLFDTVTTMAPGGADRDSFRNGSVRRPPFGTYALASQALG
jgi:hypothetical protein